MTWTIFFGFLVAILPIALTPGASMTLATQRSLAGERAATGWVVAGTATGIYLHATLAGLGLSALVMRSAEVFTVVKLVGAAYLIALGALSLWRSRKRVVASSRRRLPWAGHHPYPQAVLSNVLNPKAAAVYLTLAPQFLSAGRVSVGALIVLASAHVLVMATWLGVWGVTLSGAHRVVGVDGFRTWINRASGAVLVALGVRTATTTWSHH